MCSADCFLAVLAVFFPPIAVWVKCGICSADSVINIALLCLCYLPGLLHAWYIIAKYPDPYSYNYESIEGGNQRVYYYTATYPSVAAHTQPSYSPQQPNCHHQHHHCNENQPIGNPAHPQFYGTTSTAPASAIETVAVDPPKNSTLPQDQLLVADGMSHPAASSSSAGPSQAPPSYNDVVKGDYKVQTE